MSCPDWTHFFWQKVGQIGGGSALAPTGLSSVFLTYIKEKPRGVKDRYSFIHKISEKYRLLRICTVFPILEGVRFMQRYCRTVTCTEYSVLPLSHINRFIHSHNLYRTLLQCNRFTVTPRTIPPSNVRELITHSSFLVILVTSPGDYNLHIGPLNWPFYCCALVSYRLTSTV